jgi:hypothetical protein
MMPVQNIRRNVAGTDQTAVGGTADFSVLYDWTNADNWVAIVELTISARGATSNSVNVYYRREVFELTAGEVACTTPGSLVAATIIEEDSAWDAVVELLGTSILVSMTGDAAEVVDWSWSGTITMQKVT